MGHFPLMQGLSTRAPGDLEFYQDTGVYFRTRSSTRIQGFISGPGVLPGYRGLFQDLEFYQDTRVYFKTWSSIRVHKVLF